MFYAVWQGTISIYYNVALKYSFNFEYGQLFKHFVTESIFSSERLHMQVWADDNESVLNSRNLVFTSGWATVKADEGAVSSVKVFQECEINSFALCDTH